MNKLINTKNYQTFLKKIKEQIQTSQTRAISSVNSEMIILYYNIGKAIHEKQKKEGWGTKVVQKLSLDLKTELPKVKGFSERNIKRMVRFYREYSDISFVPQAVAQIEHLIFSIPWGHNTVLIEKVENREERFFYMQQIIKSGYSRSMLVDAIKSQLHLRNSITSSNFKELLSPTQSDLAIESFKDPYLFDFLTMAEPFRERELELSLVEHMEKFLLELGSGFAFVGRQYHLEVSNKDFYIDLLFYHLKLRSYIVIELKKGEFKPSYSGQINFYCSVVDDVLAHESDNPTIGLILCQEKDEIVAEYSLRNMSQPIGISEYELTEILPKEFVSSLPTIEMIENEFLKIEE